MTDDIELTITNGIDRTAVEPIVREGIIVLGVLGVTLLGIFLPGAGRKIPGTGVELGGVVVSLGTLVIVSSFLYAMPAIRELVTECLEGPPGVVADAASIAGYVAAFVAVLIAHRGFAPVLGNLIYVAWAYDLAFLLSALILLGAITYRFARMLGPLTRLLTVELFGRDRQGADGNVEGEP
jgi:hypothetical protein